MLQHTIEKCLATSGFHARIAKCMTCGIGNAATLELSLCSITSTIIVLQAWSYFEASVDIGKRLKCYQMVSFTLPGTSCSHLRLYDAKLTARSSVLEMWTLLPAPILCLLHGDAKQQILTASGQDSIMPVHSHLQR